jgi:hypothetical protein
MAEEIVEKKMAEKEDEKNFSSLKDKISSMKLSEAVKKHLDEEYKELRAVGLPKGKALAKAMQIVGVKEKNPQDEKFKAMKLPTPGYEKPEEDEDFTPFNEEGMYDRNKGTEAQRIAALEKQRNPNRMSKAYFGALRK